MIVTNYSRKGATIVQETTFPEVWVDLHQKADQWLTLGDEFSNIIRKLRCDEQNFITLSLLKSACASTWHSLCTAAGMTVYGAVALSWCKDAELSQVWEGWEASGFPLKPLPEFERPARFINPALLPETNSLLELAQIAENKPLPICTMIVAKGDALDVDLSVEMAAKANPQISSFLKAYMERKSDRTAEQNQMIEVWTEKVSGTEWEV